IGISNARLVNAPGPAALVGIQSTAQPLVDSRTEDGQGNGIGRPSIIPGSSGVKQRIDRVRDASDMVMVGPIRQAGAAITLPNEGAFSDSQRAGGVVHGPARRICRVMSKGAAIEGEGTTAGDRSPEPTSRSPVEEDAARAVAVESAVIEGEGAAVEDSAAAAG